MELCVLEEKKNRLVFELKGTNHTLCNALKSEMNDAEGVKIATYSIRHPQISSPKIIVETDGSITPKEALKKAVNGLRKSAERFRKTFVEEVR